MNVFFLDFDSEKCAAYHCDKHVCKMIVEYAQLLSTAHHVLDGESSRFKGSIYKKTHQNHPSAVWARECCGNYKMLYALFVSLLREYEKRYGRKHATGRLESVLFEFPEAIPCSESGTCPPLCMPEEYKVSSYSHSWTHVVDSYRAYYIGDKSRFAKWKNAEIPPWWK